MSKRKKPAAYCEGYQAFQKGRECKYPVDDTLHRLEWAEGFMDAKAEHQKGKVWWKSKTLWGCAACCMLGAGLILFGHHLYPSGSGMMSGVGGGLTIGSVVNVFFRLITREPVQWGNGYGGNYGN